MLRTEEEARQCWCPFARSDSRPAITVAVSIFGNCTCVASECQAWRQSKKSAWQRGDKWFFTEKEPENYSSGRWVKIGYCGLAGRPEL